MTYISRSTTSKQSYKNMALCNSSPNCNNRMLFKMQAVGERVDQSSRAGLSAESSHVPYPHAAGPLPACFSRLLSGKGKMPRQATGRPKRAAKASLYGGERISMMEKTGLREPGQRRTCSFLSWFSSA